MSVTKTVPDLPAFTLRSWGCVGGKPGEDRLVDSLMTDHQGADRATARDLEISRARALRVRGMVLKDLIPFPPGSVAGFGQGLS